LCEAIRIRIRYDFQDENKETRRERNARFGKESPELIITAQWQYLWDWYEALSAGVGRAVDGVCNPIPWSEFLAWSSVSGVVVHPSEYAILRAMDAVFCEEMNKEFSDYRARLDAKTRPDAEK